MSRLTRPQRAVRALAGIVLVLATANLAAGWYYSGQIRADALQASPWLPEKTLVVNDSYLESGNQGSVTLLEDATVEPALRLDATYGLEYEGGYGQLSGPSSEVDRRVTRSFTLLTGRPPRLGQRAALDQFAYPAEPVAPAEEVTYPGPLGTLSGVFHSGASDTWFIAVHGKGSRPEEMYRQTAIANRAGLPSLTIRYRNDTGVDPDPSGYYGFGATEWQDLAAAIDYARSKGATGVVLSGNSMGGAVVAAYLSRSDDTRDTQLRGIVLDSPLLDLPTTIKWNAGQLEMAGGLNVPGYLSSLALWLAEKRYDVDFDAADYLTDTSWVSAPTLVFHGGADDLVPIATSRKLAEKTDQVTLVEQPDAFHTQVWNADPAAYEKTLLAFLKQTTNG